MLAGYAFAMFDFPAKRVLFYLVMSGLMIPFTVVIVPVVQLLAVSRDQGRLADCRVGCCWRRRREATR